MFVKINLIEENIIKNNLYFKLNFLKKLQD